MMKKTRLLIILGNLTAFGPFVTDFYLPCLPELTSCFAVPAPIIQMSLTAGMLGLSVGQLLIGPVSDKYGRKRPLLWCLTLFILATLGCMLSTDIRPFIFFRLLQGLTGASGLVISKAIVADTFTAAELTGYFAVLAAVQGAAPVAAPVLGGMAFSLSSWQGAFGLLGLWCVGLLYACRRLGESLGAENRLRMPVWKTFGCYVPVVRNGRYIVMNLLQGFASAALMAYISASPFIFQQHFGLTPLQYGLCFAGNALGLVVGSGAVMKMRNLQRAAGISSVGLLVSGSLASAVLSCGGAFLLFEVFLFAMLFCVGMVTPVAITQALSAITENRGVASALLGATPFLLGGIVAPLTGIGDMIRSMGIIMISCSAVCVLLYLLSRKWSRTGAEELKECLPEEN